MVVTLGSCVSSWLEPSGKGWYCWDTWTAAAAAAAAMTTGCAGGLGMLEIPAMLFMLDRLGVEGELLAVVTRDCGC